jgi:hypothetical protein
MYSGIPRELKMSTDSSHPVDDTVRDEKGEEDSET